MTKKEIELMNKLIDQCDYPDLLRELINKKFESNNKLDIIFPDFN